MSKAVVSPYCVACETRESSCYNAQGEAVCKFHTASFKCFKCNQYSQYFDLNLSTPGDKALVCVKCTPYSPNARIRCICQYWKCDKLGRHGRGFFTQILSNGRPRNDFCSAEHCRLYCIETDSPVPNLKRDTRDSKLSREVTQSVSARQDHPHSESKCVCHQAG